MRSLAIVVFVVFVVSAVFVASMLGCTATPPVHAPALAAQPTVVTQLEALPDLDGRLVGPSDAPTILVVFASWCEHCKAELAELEPLRSRHVRLLGVNYRGHEEYDHRGNSVAVRAFADRTPWLRVVPIGDAMFEALGRPPQIPTLYVFDTHGTLVETFDRRARKPPDRSELLALLQRLGA